MLKPVINHLLPLVGKYKCDRLKWDYSTWRVCLNCNINIKNTVNDCGDCDDNGNIIIIIPIIITVTDDYDYIKFQHQYLQFKIVKSHNRYYYQNKNAKY